MNATRRKALSEIFEQLDDLKNQLETLATEERDQFDNMSEKRQDSAKGRAVDEAARYLEDAVGDLSSALDNIENATPPED